MKIYCPACGKTSAITLDIISPDITEWTCPECGQKFEIDMRFNPEDE